MRKIINSILGILLIIGAIFIAKSFIKNKQKPKPKFAKVVKTVFVDTVVNKDIPISLKASGNLIAKRKIELFSEIQGVMKSLKKDFKAGTKYAIGETILSINSMNLMPV